MATIRNLPVRKKASVSRLKVPKRRRPRTVKCIAYENRTKRRIFTPKKIGDIVCHLLKDRSELPGPQLKAELRKELNRCFPCTESDTETEKRLRQAAAVAADALRDTATVIAVALAVLVALGLLVRVFPLLPRIALALIPGGARVAVTQIPGLIARMQARRAANDSVFRLLVGL